MKLRLLAPVFVLVVALLPSHALRAQTQGPIVQEMPIGSALFAADEKAELLIAQSVAGTSPFTAQSTLIVRDSNGSTLASVDLPNPAASGATGDDGIIRWINTATVEVLSGYLVVNGLAYAEIESEAATSTPFFTNYRPQFYLRTSSVTESLPRVTLNVLGPAAATRAARSVIDGYWPVLPYLEQGNAATPVSIHQTETVAFTYQRIERSSSASVSVRSEGMALMFVDALGQTLGSVDLPDGDSGTIAAAMSGGELTVNGELLGPLAPDPNTGRFGFGVYLLLDNPGENTGGAASTRRNLTITVYDQSSGETRASYNCQLVDGQLPPGLTISGCAS
jgi:hypothetical protein